MTFVQLNDSLYNDALTIFKEFTTMSMQQQESSTRAIFYAFLANLGIALTKTWAAIVTSSGSMLAEAIHSFADCTNQVLLYVGLRQSVKPPDEEHPLGYGKTSYFWSFIVAVLLFSMGGLFSVYEGWHKFHAPEPVSHIWIALTVLGISLILELFSLLGCLREIKKMRKDKSFWEWFQTTRNAELVVVLAEDNAAIIGLSLAFVFVLLTGITGNPVYDAMGSISIGMVLITISIFVASRIKTLMLGRSAEPDLRKLIDDIIIADENIESLLNTITVQFGPDIMLAAKIKMQSGISIETAVEKINLLEREIKRQAPAIKWCFIEPDNTD